MLGAIGYECKRKEDSRNTEQKNQR